MKRLLLRFTVQGFKVQRLEKHEEPVLGKAGIEYFEDIEAWQLARELSRKYETPVKKITMHR